ncbi:hypothetical protein [Microbacterium thalli]|uniref:DUF1440 domain-containing protein n=1 Tax=Microbacterium thalli TaxID=3027921 RepID=A0ABT5SM90_9MICO|nr:hypothetical protein [Microbacterium thalli]MDD7963137.1 hypothetical protein [Microbacterium thalli]
MTPRTTTLTRAAGRGAVAGLVAGSVMMLTEKFEQAITRRPDSFVPARALLSALGRRPSDASTPTSWNHVMHYLTAAALGALRGVWSAVGIRGAYANVWHCAVRLAFDQTVENTTGAGAPPHTWPARELAVDVIHKFVFSLVTGIITDRIIRPRLASARGKTSH